MGGVRKRLFASLYVLCVMKRHEKDIDATMRIMRFRLVLLIIFLLNSRPIWASEVLGVHILSTGELDAAQSLVKTETRKDAWDYVTIPFTLDDIHRKTEWQRFFYQARDMKFQPIVRLATRFQNGVWVVPTRKDIVDMVTVLSTLDWPQPHERIVVVMNEPNHVKEWGNRIDPAQYAHILQFAADWMHTEMLGYVVLPAGLDLDAPNGNATMEAFTFLERMIDVEPRVLNSLDGWTSHSYPNPAFSAPPTQTGKNSLRGFEFELAFLKKYSDREFPVYITETGWVETQKTKRWLPQYYQYAVDHIWSDPRVRAVTPFVLKGAPGSFAQFSFYDSSGKPTLHFNAYQKALEK